MLIAHNQDSSAHAGTSTSGNLQDHCGETTWKNISSGPHTMYMSTKLLCIVSGVKHFVTYIIHVPLLNAEHSPITNDCLLCCYAKIAACHTSMRYQHATPAPLWGNLTESLIRTTQFLVLTLCSIHDTCAPATCRT